MSPLEQANMSPFSEHASNEGACRLVALEENSVYLTFFFLYSITYPQVPYDSALSHEYLKPLTFTEADLKFFLPSPQLTAS